MDTMSGLLPHFVVAKTGKGWAGFRLDAAGYSPMTSVRYSPSDAADALREALKKMEAEESEQWRSE